MQHMLHITLFPATCGILQGMWTSLWVCSDSGQTHSVTEANRFTKSISIVKGDFLCSANRQFAGDSFMQLDPRNIKWRHKLG